MSAPERVRYTRLPGRRRGVISGSSVWQGPDHLLLIRSWRIREQYKRYYLGDIQSIAVAEAPRFHISTRSIGIAILWLIAYSIAVSVHSDWAEISLWVIAAVLVLTWIYVSARCSCICRIYTAVSGDELPSLYRTWTARKFMRIVEPQIRAVQNSLEGEWADEVEARRIGPPEEAHGAGTMVAGMSTTPSPEIAAQYQQRQSLLLPAVFIVVMLADAILSYFALKHHSVALDRVGYGVLAIEIGLSVVLLIQHYRGKLLAGMQKLVIASILCTGVTWYAQPVIQSIYIAGTAARTPGRAIRQPAPNDATGIFDIAAHVLWVVWGAGILLTQQQRKPREIIAE